MSNSPFPGDELRQRREEMGLSVDDVYRKIRIPIQYILAMESGDLSTLPTTAYAVGFLKTYAIFLQLQPARFIDYFHEGQRPASRQFLRNRTPEEPGARPIPAWVQNAASWTIVLAIVAFGWFTWHVVVRSSAQAPAPAAAGTIDQVEPPAPRATRQ